MNSSWSLALVHGIPGVIPTMDRLAREACPGVTVFNLLHEGLFLELSRAGYATPPVIRGIAALIVAAEQSGASVVLVTGSTFSPAVDVARRLVSVPVVKIDEAMAEEVVKKGRRIGLVATEEATLAPSSDIISLKAREAGVPVEISTEVCPGARLLHREGDVAGHDALVAAAVRKLSGKVDTIVLAQASMYSALALLDKQPETPVYASPELAVQHVRRMLQALGWQPPRS